ncbi:MAG: bifunctional precorrin-2 dehydrogenase/sirohydrochlorin ferrochelatase, partial [Hydrotalea flava]|nr:bifunctional precorrin-2 dehydrogenase/sirohydrochlorin ferrochelatase [Hydrotalea flava]NIM39100.1 bifunctional precorrin-2 dehydrogenase/sirohydrochlorin ferrochelatase [Hydrotalea flava]NIN04335.1 bifunctional precorrin-2 dehydrogenase/sirohydrochlorin ferrochelatase [Hydrotalea flava]NIN15961.1 bifunctional precorrin-2 dehydrogenase/sirohydrochlorin ferrochelatase [Hydrotalea flava]NIO95026.1 bifunctional precorrin-2 dehydrogenase/sirohydrochlorin ferrochelatase [Hydrotalea flava]
MNHLFPVFLKLEELHTLIVGGGNVGLEKITAVLSNSPNARVTLIAPEIRNEIKQLTENNSLVSLIYRKFMVKDLKDKDIVIIATENQSENKRICDLAKRKRLLCNVADTPDICDFYLSSVVQKQNLKIAISTNGVSPTMAKRIKEILHNSLPDDIETTLNNLQQIRKYLTGDFSEKVAQLNKLTE